MGLTYPQVSATSMRYNKKQKEMSLNALSKSLKAHENKWVALVGSKVVADGRSPMEVKKKAEQKGIKNYTFYLVPSSAIRFSGYGA